MPISYKQKYIQPSLKFVQFKLDDIITSSFCPGKDTCDGADINDTVLDDPWLDSSGSPSDDSCNDYCAFDNSF